MTTLTSYHAIAYARQHACAINYQTDETYKVHGLTRHVQRRVDADEAERLAEDEDPRRLWVEVPSLPKPLTRQEAVALARAAESAALREPGLDRLYRRVLGEIAEQLRAGDVEPAMSALRSWGVYQHDDQIVWA